MLKITDTFKQSLLEVYGEKENSCERFMALTKKYKEYFHMEEPEYFTSPGRMEPVSYTHLDVYKRQGEKLAIVGLNGAGKTTLVKLICGFLDPTDGKVLLNNTDIRTYNRRDYYRLFSAVFQDFSVLDVTIAENIAQTDENINTDMMKRCIDVYKRQEYNRYSFSWGFHYFILCQSGGNCP